MQSSRSRRGTVSSGILTGISTAAVSGTAAVAGVILSRKFGHGVKTDGFFAAYQLYLAVVLLASVVRIVALPRLVRARADGRLPAETGVWVAALAGPLAVVVLVAIAWPHGLSVALTSQHAARPYAEELLPWVIASSAAQVLGGLVASALAALDDYAVAAYGFAAGSIAGDVHTVAPMQSFATVSKRAWTAPVSGSSLTIAPRTSGQSPSDPTPT